MPARRSPQSRSCRTSVLSALFLGAGAALLHARRRSIAHSSGTTPSIWTDRPCRRDFRHDEESPAQVSPTQLPTAPGGTKVKRPRSSSSPTGYATVASRRPASVLHARLPRPGHPPRWASEPNSVAPASAVRPAPSVRRRPLPRARAYWHPRHGDLASLQRHAVTVQMPVTTTDAFTMDDPLSGAKTAIIILTPAPTTLPTFRQNATSRSMGFRVPTRRR